MMFVSRFRRSLSNLPGSIQEQIALRLRSSLKEPVVDVVDTSGGCGTFLSVRVVSSEFEGIGTAQRHRVINNLIKEWIPSIHGLTITALSPGDLNKPL